MPPAFRHAVCNELYGDWPFGEAMKHIRKAGYAGVEIAPFTLSEDPAAIEAGKRREYRSTRTFLNLPLTSCFRIAVSSVTVYTAVSNVGKSAIYFFR